MTATTGRLGSCPTTRRIETEDIPSRKPRLVVLWSVALSTAVIIPVGVSDPRYYDQRSSSSLCFSMSGGYTYGTGEEVGKLTEQIGSTCRDVRVISFPLTSTSSGERPEGHPAWDCRRGSRRWVRTSPSRPKSFLHRLWETPSSPTIPRSKLVLDEFIYRKHSS